MYILNIHKAASTIIPIYIRPIQDIQQPIRKFVQRINIIEIDREQVDSRIQENGQAMWDKSYIDSHTRKATGWNQLKIWYLKVQLQAAQSVHHMVKTQDGTPDLRNTSNFDSPWNCKI